MANPGVRVLGGKLTVSAEPFFWLLSGFLGLSLGRGSAREVVLWAVVVAVSVLVHELGHAAVCLVFGSGADIVLHGMGGSTRPRDLTAFGTWRTAMLNLAGCAAGIALAATAFGVILAAGVMKMPLSPGARQIAIALVEVNIWFSLFNLLPLMPMDGGKFVAGLLRAGWGVKGERAAHVFGLVLGAAVALYFLKRGATFGAVLCGLMAAGEARSLKRSLSMTEADSDETVTRELPRAMELWENGKREEAVTALMALRKRAGAGLTYEAATLQLAFYLYALDRNEESYEMFKLAPESDMSGAAKIAYADVAQRHGDFALALRLGRTNFHNQPGAQAAVSVAVAAAGLGDARETVTWLKTAIRLGLEEDEVRAPEFDAVRNTDEFREFLSDLY